jgi:hypothetical protein
MFTVRATGGLTKEERGRRIISQKTSDSRQTGAAAQERRKNTWAPLCSQNLTTLIFYRARIN